MSNTENFANNAITSLNGAITNSQTTITVASNTGFPAATTGSGQFRVIIDSEILIVTNASGVTWTVTRGAEGSTGVSHLTGATVTHIFTAGNIANLGPSGSFSSLLTAGNISGASTAANYNAGGITSGRFLGFTPGVAPTGGPYLAQDFTYDSTYPGVIWMCTAGGSPGTWIATGSGAYASVNYAGAGQSIANSTNVIANFDTIVLDNYNLTSNAHGGTGAHSTYTCPIDGIYMVTGLVTFVSATYTDIVPQIWKNGSEIRRGLRVNAGTCALQEPAVGSFHCAVGDYLQFAAYQTSGGSRNTVAGNTLTWMQIRFVGSA